LVAHCHENGRLKVEHTEEQRKMRDARIPSIHEETSEIRRVVIGTALTS
jgi:alkylation response protein AidB-like acyl-CoA dehydrogenase